MQVIDLALKDVMQVLRDRKSALFLVVIPILFALFFGAVFGGQGSERDPRLPVGFVNHDLASSLGTNLFSLLETSASIRPVVLDEKQATKAAEQARDGKLAAVVIVPANYGKAAWGDQAAKATVIVDMNSLAGQTAINAIDAATTRLLGAVQIAQLSAKAYEDTTSFTSDEARQGYLDQALTLASAAWQKPPLSVTVEQAGVAAKPQVSINTQTSPGSIVQFTIYGLIMSAGLLVMERKSGAMQRLLTTPINRAGIIAGHALAMFFVVMIQQALLILFGQFALGVGYLREPLATFIVALSLGLWVVSLGMLIGAICKTDDQVIMWSLIAMFIFAAMGGAWFSLEQTGKAFSAIGHLMPTAWAMDGFQNIVVRGLGLSSVLLPAGILLAYASVFFALAVWRFRFE